MDIHDWANYGGYDRSHIHQLSLQKCLQLEDKERDLINYFIGYITILFSIYHYFTILFIL